MAAENDGASSSAVAGPAGVGDSSLRAGNEGRLALTVASPWARYWAKMFDLTLGWLILWVALTLPAAVTALVAPRIFDVIIQLPKFWFTFFLTPVVVAIEATLYGVFGNTPGKRLLGLQVLSLQGERLGLGRIFQREFGVYTLGLGMMFPAVPLFTLVRAHHTAKDGDPQPWDVATQSRCYSVRNTTMRTWIGAAVTVALAAVIFGPWTGGD